MFIGTREYTRADYPWADFSKIKEITFDQVFLEIGLDTWLTKEGTAWTGPCPFHPKGDGAINADSASRWFKCVGCARSCSGDVSDFISKFMYFEHKVQSDMWLLQFAPSERHKVIEIFGVKISALTVRARQDVEQTYDPIGYSDRCKSRKLLTQITEGEHDRLFDTIVEVILRDFDALVETHADNLREFVYQKVSSTLESRSYL